MCSIIVYSISVVLHKMRYGITFVEDVQTYIKKDVH